MTSDSFEVKVEVDMLGDCLSCPDDDMKCPASKRACGHHCNHSWTHGKCCWCGRIWEVDEP